MRSSPKRTVAVVPWQSSWSDAFAMEQAVLFAALGDTALALHHIGSTAVPGLAAKPILDLLLEVPNLASLDAKTADLAALGYVAKGENGIPNRRYFQKGGLHRTHHLHAFVHAAPEVIQHLLFRDYLRATPTAVAAYAALKLQLAQQFPQDSSRYQAGKQAFIAQLLQQARLTGLNTSG